MRTQMMLAAAVLIGGLAAGCAGPNELDAEPDRVRGEEVEEVRMAGVDARPDDAVAVDPVPNPAGDVSRTDLLNAQKLEVVPEPVRRSFNQRFPKAAITSVYQLDAASGLLIYEINFIQNGRPYDVMYRPNGQTLTRTPMIDAPGNNDAGASPR